ncbi:CAP domain-containing protein [Sorangium sp. So ce1097]|uniref:CAP domain-containing protein n=1 Tax=Sorangium sp. So ce1097 TaxID=3133330 RepID=UPI003F62CAF1
MGDRSPEGTCARFNADTADMSEGTWSGSLDPGCDPGDISADGRANALRLFNLYRWLADLPPVVTEPTRDAQAQACALMMDANNSLSHEPPESWKCYSKTGADGARTSNISSGPGVASVLGYLIDPGNESTFGHRRIILSNDLGPIGLGSTGKNGASCMQNIGGTGRAGKEWTAWPPPGVFPMQAYGDRWSSLSDTGWSIQSEDIELEDAEVTITSGGAPLAVDVEPLQGGYGSTNAIRIVPNGWDPEAGQTYSVSVSGISATIAYDVVFVDCG